MEERIYKTVSLVLKILILASVIFNLFIGEYPLAIFLFLALLLMIYLSRYFSDKEHKPIVESLFLSLILLNIIGIYWAYETFPFYDDLFHLYSGILIVLMILPFFHKPFLKNETLLMIAAAIILILLGFAWELFEFFWDQLISIPMNKELAQKSTLDTITDILWSTLGGLIVIIIYCFSKIRK